MKKVLISLPPQMLEATDRLVKAGYFASRSEAVRAGLRMLFETEGGAGDEHGVDVMDFLAGMESPRDFSYS